MGKPAARRGDKHICPAAEGPKPHVGGPIIGGSSSVWIGGMPAAIKGNKCTCVGPLDSISKGSKGVFINGTAAARMGDSCTHGGKIIQGCMSVWIGDKGGAQVDVDIPEELEPVEPAIEDEPPGQGFWSKVWGAIKAIVTSVAFMVGIVVAVALAIIGGKIALIVGIAILVFMIGYTMGQRLVSLWDSKAPWYKWVIYLNPITGPAFWLLDGLGLISLVEGSFGYDLVTWEKLSEDEQASRLAGGIVAAVMLILTVGLSKFFPRPVVRGKLPVKPSKATGKPKPDIKAKYKKTSPAKNAKDKIERIDTSKVKSEEVEALKKTHEDRANKIKERDKHKNPTEKYKAEDKKVRDSSEKLGEQASDIAMEKIKGKPGELFTGKGKRNLDKVYIYKDGTVAVVEAKGAKSDLGSKSLTGGKRAEQGTAEYLQQTLKEMKQRGGKDAEIAQKVEQALNTGKLKYYKVSQKIASDGSLKPIEVKEFEID